MRSHVLSPRTARSILPLLLGAVLLTGCDLFGTDDDDVRPLETTGVFVANGGNFTDQNGTITVFNPQSGRTTTPPSLELNAFVHSITLRGNRLYAQLNTDFSRGRVDIIDPDSLAIVNQSETLGAPRNVTFPEGNTSRGYVSTLNGTVQRFDPASGDLEGSPVDIGPSASDLAVVESTVFTTIPDSSLALSDTISNNGSSLAVFDAGAPSSLRTIDLGCDGPSAIAQDEEGELVVVCTGRTTFSADFSEVLRRTDGEIVFVDPSDESVLERVPLNGQVGSNNGTQVAHYDSTSALLHAASTQNGEIFRVDTDANALIETIAVPEESSLTGIAALAYDGLARRLYVARSDVDEPFQSRGTVVVLGSSQNQIDQFVVGPGPSHIAIRRESR